jgi:23S rRNA pseudouridine1911/1915/1917 synthase
MSKLVEQTFTVTSLELAKVDAAVKTLIEVPRSQLRALFQNGCVTVNGKVCGNPGTMMKVGDVLKLNYEAGRKYKETRRVPNSRDFNVVFEDAHLIVVDKQPGVLSVPTTSGEGSTLISKINHHRPKDRPVEVVHRLDRDTSGLLVFGKSSSITRKLKEQFKSRKPQRLYHAIVRGKVMPKKGTIQSYLSTDKDLNQYSVHERDKDSGKLAITHYTVEQYLADATWVKVELETGRRNQIRVHFSERNNPVLGDKRYNRSLAAHPFWRSEYLALHATTLGFNHPITNKPLFFESPMPYRMAMFIEKNRGKK